MGALENKKILWVEDDKFLSDLITRKLSTENCKLTHSSTAEEALEHLNGGETPDIIVLDILLPGGISGLDLLEKIREMPNTKNTPVIMFTNMGQKADVERASKLAVKKFLVKAAVSLDEIINEIGDVLSEEKTQ